MTEPPTSHSLDAERRLSTTTGWALLAAAALLVSAAAINNEHRLSASDWYGAAASDPGRFYAAHILVLASGVLLVIGLLGVAYLTSHTHPTTSALGAALSVLGFLGGAAMIGQDLLVWRFADSSLDAGGVVDVLDDLRSPGVAIPLAALLLGLALGPALLALALYREHLASRATAILLPVGVAGGLLSFPITGVRLATAGCVAYACASTARQLIGGHGRHDGLHLST